jgi:hypothetical protein
MNDTAGPRTAIEALQMALTEAGWYLVPAQDILAALPPGWTLTRDQDAAVLALREALARWLPLSQNPSIAEEWPDKYLDLVWGPNGDKANTYGQLRADLRLLSDHSAAADDIRERVERQDAALCGAVLTCARPIGHYEYHERADGIQWLWPTGGGSVMGNEYVPLATQQPAEGGDS